MKKIIISVLTVLTVLSFCSAAFAELQPGDTCYFGTWPQEKKGDPVEIEWQVLAVEEGRVLLITKYGIEAGRYHQTYTRVTWESSDMRAWLNGEFYDTAFDPAEKERIAEVQITNPDNTEMGAKGGNDTKDRIFLLSIDEAGEYFPDDDARRCGFTKVSKGNATGYATDKAGNSVWWLRSPGKVDVLVGYTDGSVVHEDGTDAGSRNAAAVDLNGRILVKGISVNSGKFLIRPALWLDLE